MAKIELLLVAVHLTIASTSSNRYRRGSRPLEESSVRCQKPNILNENLQNCINGIQRYFYYDAENKVCVPYEDCQESGADKFSDIRSCTRACTGSVKKPARRCQQQSNGKAPERCRWVRDTAPGPNGVCPKYQLQCSGGPCSTRPCSAPCEICTYNLEFTTRNCSSVTRIDGNGDECPPPFRCERDIRCKANAATPEIQEVESESAPVTKITPVTSAKRPTTVQFTTSSTLSTDQPESISDSEQIQVSATSEPDPVIPYETAHSCLVPVAHKPCSTESSSARLVWYFDLQSKLCRRFYGMHTCAGNTNGFRTKEECVRICQGHKACPQAPKKSLPAGCKYENRTGQDGCLTLAVVCVDKPGRCPIPSGNGSPSICYKECDRDADCNAELKCCPNGCASLCLAPAPSLLPTPTPDSNVAPKTTTSGITASTTSAGFAMATVTDSNRSSSTSTSATTTSISTTTATAAITTETVTITMTSTTMLNTEAVQPTQRPKTGACPMEKRRRTGHRHCADYEKCTVDEDCQGVKRCCFVAGCGRVCRSPVELSPVRSYNPCHSSPCQLFERCMPVPASSIISDHQPMNISYKCEPIKDLTQFDPCKNGKHTCPAEEACAYEPQLCLMGPCPRYRCIPTPTPGFRRKIYNGSDVKRAMDTTQADPCYENPCRPCQRCVPLDAADDQRKHQNMDGAKSAEYYCENNCPGLCEECAITGRCSVTKPPHSCRTDQGGDACQNRTCDSYPSAKCIVDPCHCLRVRFILDSGVQLSSSDCRRAVVSIMRS